MKDNVILAGVGHLGGRHLQALALYPKELTIYLIEPNEANVKRAIQWFSESDRFGNKNIIHIEKLAELPKVATLLIVATNSKHRFQITEDVINNSSVSFIVLEKFLFNDQNEYDLLEKKLEGITTFVNCSRRMWPTYQMFKDRIDLSHPVVLKVSGTNYGIAGNAVHYFDLYSFLTGCTDFDVDITGVDQVISNKREGYIEFLGSIHGQINGDTVIYITDTAESSVIHSQFEIQIENGPITYCINEAEESLTILNQDVVTTEEFTMYYQSVLTAEILKQLLEWGTCHLVSYSESSKVHQNLLQAYQAKLKEFGIEGMFT